MDVARKVGLVLLFAFAAVSTLQAINNSMLVAAAGNDFQWGPSRALLNGVDPYAAHARGDSDWQHMAQYPNYPVSGLVFLLPFGALDWESARTLWALTNFAMTGLIIWLLCVPVARIGRDAAATIPWRSGVVMLAALLGSMAWRNSMGKGQHGIFSLCFTLIAVAVLHRGTTLSGLAVAVAWFKPTLGIPLSLYLARTRQGIRILAVSAATHAALTAGAALWLGSSILELLLGPVRTGQDTTPRGRLDVFRVASDLGIEGTLVPIAAAVLIAGLSLWSIRKERDALSGLSTMCFATLVVAFHSGYDFVIGTIPVAYALRERFGTARAWYMAVPFLLIWFAERPVLELVNRGLMAPSGVPAYIYHWSTIIVFYGAMVADWSDRLGWRRTTTATTSPATGS